MIDFSIINIKGVKIFMELSHEDIVTRLLSKREILQHNNNFVFEKIM